MKVIIAGGRKFQGSVQDRAWLIDRLKKLGATETVSGKAPGADRFGEEVSDMIHLPSTPFKANWNKYGKKAGGIRNTQMAMYADAVILFPGGTGTADMKQKAIDNGLIIIEKE